MVIIDRLLEEREREGVPIRVGLVGAGHIGRAYALQLLRNVPGMTLVAVANRTEDTARRVFAEAGICPERVTEVGQLDDIIASGRHAVTGDPSLLCQAEGIDAIVEATGQVESGAKTAMAAIRHRKHVILSNAELDSTLGPILKVHADQAGVVFTNTDGDEPGVAMNLFRFVKNIGYLPVLAGNLKGFLDRRRTPTTQQAFAALHGLSTRMATSAADGTKLSQEVAVLANATGFHVGRRGMYGPTCAHVKDAPNLFQLEELLQGGLVDYLLGAEPNSGAFVVGYTDQPVQTQYMRYFKMGDGPLYVFYEPFHLPHLQLPNSVARAVLLGDATVAPRGAPVCEVVAIAKRDLKAGESLDGIGGFTCYGLIENASIADAEALLPIGVSEGCRLIHEVRADRAIRFCDVTPPEGRLCDRLRKEQTAYFEGHQHGPAEASPSKDVLFHFPARPVGSSGRQPKPGWLLEDTLVK
jgi:predicted homoserine dehydrogenase-like protein